MKLKTHISLLLFILMSLISVAQTPPANSNDTLPDNVFNVACSLPPDSNAFAIRALFSCPGVNSMSTPMVADMDGDGIPEIIACPNTNHSPWFSSGLLIFDGRTGVLKRTITTQEYVLHGQFISIADVDNDGQSEIFILDRTGNVNCYNYSGSRRWFNLTAIDRNYLISVADINGDGVAELVCGKYIFNATDGTLLLNGSMTDTGRGFALPHGYNASYHIPYYMYALADIDGDGTLELCAGNSIYKINITNTAGTTGNSWTLLRQATYDSSIDNLDGETFVVDFDGDGDMDICVIGTSYSIGPPSPVSSHTVSPYVWDGQTGNIIAHSSISVNNSFGPSIPYSGDLDGNGLPEIIFSIANIGMKAYTFDTNHAGNMRLMHNHAPFDETSGYTVFDFNQDGHDEIVYRNDSNLYIVDGSSLNALSTPITAYSGTITEYPVVADVNADGHAEILIAQSNTPWTGMNSQGTITVYGSVVPGTWSSARKVWNQWAYNSVNINEDLTVPQHHFDISTRFPNGNQPFNAFLRQMPYFNQNGDMFTPIADIVVAQASCSTYNDSVRITVEYSNQGHVDILAPYGITLYKNEYRGMIITTDTLTQTLHHSSSQTTSHTLTIPRSVLCTFNETDSLIISINDLGSGIAQHGNQQPECDTTNNTLKIATPVFHNFGDTIATACDSFTWWNTNYTNSTNTPTHVYTNSHGCDSTVTLDLTINYSNTGDTTAIACDSFSWWNTIYTSSTNTTTHIYTNTQGCDSVVTLHLTVNYSNTGDTTTTACESFSWWNTDYTNSTNSATHTFTNVAGCDSVVTLHLTINYNNTGDTIATACDSITWWNTVYTNSTNSATHTLTNTAGCDSVVTLHLTVNHNNTGDTNVTTCDSFTWWNTNYTNSTSSATHTLTNAAGCDSVVTLHLTVNYSNTGDTSATACDSLTWWNTVYTNSTNTPTHVYTNTQGCDSTVTLHLTIKSSSLVNETATVCTDQLPLTWNDTILNPTSNTSLPQHYNYTFRYTNYQSCDSIVNLALTVNPTDTVIDRQEHCDNYMWQDGTVYNYSTYGPQIHISNYYGCDSIVILDLIIKHSSLTELTDSFCHGTQYEYNGNTLTTGGIFIDTIKNAVGCDSTVRLTLTMLAKPMVSIKDAPDCETQLHYIHASTNVDYLEWTVDGYWNNDWGSQHGRNLIIHHPTSLQLSLKVDYLDHTLCPNTATVTLKPIISPHAEMDVTPDFLTYDQATLTALSKSTGADWLQWYINSEDAGGENIVQYTADKNEDSVTLMLIAANSTCLDTAEKTVYMRRQTFYAPNVFTPDEPTNKTFNIFFTGIIEYKLDIYNRQGLHIFSSSSINTKWWDGTYNGHRCPQASYVWILRYRSEIDPQNWHTAKGMVTLLR